MKIDSKSPDLPISWQVKPHYNLSVQWLTRIEETQETNAEMLKDATEELDEELIEDKIEFPKIGVSKQYPGWFMHFNVTSMYVNSLEEVLTQAKKIIKNSNFSASNLGRLVFAFDQQDQNFNAPAKPVKAQRLELIRQLETPKEMIGKFDFFRDAFVEIGEYALNATIETMPFREDFETVFSDENNPILSLVGLKCVVSKEDDDGEWEEIVTGELELEGNTVRVGDWFRAFEDHYEVSGIAFGEASVLDEIEDVVYIFEAQDKSISDGDD